MSWSCCGGCSVSSLLSYWSVYCGFNTNFLARENVYKFWCSLWLPQHFSIFRKSTNTSAISQCLSYSEQDYTRPGPQTPWALYGPQIFQMLQNLMLIRSSLNSVKLFLTWYRGNSFLGGPAVKNPPANAGDAGLISGLGRSPGEGNDSPLQYSCLENPMDGGSWWATVHGVAKSQTRLSTFTFTFHFHALEREMATHSSVLAWRMPGTGEPGGLPSMGSHRVGHN